MEVIKTRIENAKKELTYMQIGRAYVWGRAHKGNKDVVLSQVRTHRNIVPDVIGMGARDAVFLLENRGVKVHLRGRGKVKSQSIYAGTVIRQGMTCELILE
jgi:cell division protein FtsI (penicillin-binding protein 3)